VIDAVLLLAGLTWSLGGMISCYGVLLWVLETWK
jgi:hypothetical protein